MWYALTNTDVLVQYILGSKDEYRFGMVYGYLFGVHVLGLVQYFMSTNYAILAFLSFNIQIFEF